MSNDTEKTAGYVAAISACLGAAAKWLLPALREWLAERRSRKAAEKMEASIVSGLQTLHSIYSAMERIQGDGADRVVIFAGHNSGGIPRAGSPFYCSALHWHVSKAYADRIADYREVSVDSAYVAMLLYLKQNGSYRFDPEREPDCILRRFYEAEGVTDSVLFYLGCHENNLLYISCCTHIGKLAPSQITSMSLHSASISRAVKQTNQL